LLKQVYHIALGVATPILEIVVGGGALCATPAHLQTVYPIAGTCATPNVKSCVVGCNGVQCTDGADQPPAHVPSRGRHGLGAGVALSGREVRGRHTLYAAVSIKTAQTSRDCGSVYSRVPPMSVR
jgi:hypothetical protein